MMNGVIKEELKAIVGEGRYLDSEEDLLLYSYDAFMVPGRPEVVLLPISTDEVSMIMKVAYREHIPVTARGAGTNLTGGSIPTHGGISMVFTKMNKILNIDKENRFAVVQPGLINMKFQKELVKFKLYYPRIPGQWQLQPWGVMWLKMRADQGQLSMVLPRTIFSDWRLSLLLGMFYELGVKPSKMLPDTT